MLIGCRWAQSLAWAVLMPSFIGLSDLCSTVSVCAAVAHKLPVIQPNSFSMAERVVVRKFSLSKCDLKCFCLLVMHALYWQHDNIVYAEYCSLGRLWLLVALKIALEREMKPRE
jgi:hypothetical protein